MLRIFKKYKKSSILIIMIIILFPCFVYANNRFQGNDITISKEQFIDGDFIQAGNQIINYGKINGDMIIASNETINEGIIQGDIISLSGFLIANGRVLGNLRLIAGNVNIRGEINRNVSILSRDIFQQQDSAVDGSMHILANHLELRGYVGGDIRASAGKIVLGGKVKGNVYVYTNNLYIAPDALIEGDLIYISEREQNIDPELVLGRIEYRNAAANPFRQLIYDLRTNLRIFSLLKRALFLMAYLIIGSILISLFKQPYTRASFIIDEIPWNSIGLGLGVVLFVPVAALIICITFIGIPIGLFMMSVYGMILYLGSIPAQIWLGLKLITDQGKPVIAFLIGSILVATIKLIPYIGWLISKGVLMVGIGATLIMVKRYYKKEYLDEI